MLVVLLLVQLVSSHLLPETHLLQKGKPKSKERLFCATPDCFFDADQVAASVDATVKPCNDFYLYACRGWIKSMKAAGKSGSPTSIQKDQIYSRIKDLFEDKSIKREEVAFGKAAKFYKACLKFDTGDAVKNLKSAISDLGGWPLGRNVAVKGWNAIAKILVKMVQYKKVEFPFKIDFYSDNKNDSSFQTIKLKFPDNLGKYSANTVTAEDVAALAKAFNPSINEKQAKSDAVAMLKVPNWIKELNSPSQMRLSKPLKQINNETGYDWRPFLTTVFKGMKEVKADEKILEYVAKYLKKLVAATKANPQTAKNLANYLVFDTIYELLKPLKGRLPAQFKRVKFLQDADASKDATLKWNCGKQTRTCFGNAVARKYAEKFHDLKEEMSKIKSMMEFVVDAGKIRLGKSAILDKESKKRALDKLKKMRIAYEYPEYGQQLKHINDFYKTLEMTKDYLTNSYRCNVFDWKDLLKDVNRPRGSRHWDPEPMVVNAFYSNGENSIYSYEGIMGPPEFYKNGSNMIAYAGFGATLAHEMNHGFGPSGSDYDGEGNQHTFLTSDSKKKYDKMTKCIVDQYDNYSFGPDEKPEAKYMKHLNGTETLGESFADINSIKLAFDAYNLWASKHKAETIPAELKKFAQNANQLFFLYYGRSQCEVFEDTPRLAKSLPGSHPPNKFRANGPLSNFDAFAKAFECPKGSPMNRGARSCNFF